MPQQKRILDLDVADSTELKIRENLIRWSGCNAPMPVEFVTFPPFLEDEKRPGVNRLRFRPDKAVLAALGSLDMSPYDRVIVGHCLGGGMLVVDALQCPPSKLIVVSNDELPENVRSWYCDHQLITFTTRVKFLTESGLFLK